jgi:hypothetical protein
MTTIFTLTLYEQNMATETKTNLFLEKQLKKKNKKCNKSRKKSMLKATADRQSSEIEGIFHRFSVLL